MFEKAGLQPAPQRGAAYQPRVQPWVDVAHNSGVLKERRIDIDWSIVLKLVLKPGVRAYAAFLQNAGGLSGKVPRALPWAGMRCPFGANGSHPPDSGMLRVESCLIWRSGKF